MPGGNIILGKMCCIFSFGKLPGGVYAECKLFSGQGHVPQCLQFFF